MRVTAFIIFICCTVGCKSKDEVPAGILKFDKMQAVLWDVIQAEALTGQFIKKDFSIDAPLENLKMQQQIFANHQIKKEEFYTSYQYYSVHVQLMRSMLDSITTLAERNKYKNLYIKQPLPARVSLIPLLPPPPVFIPMPIPTLNSIQGTTPDSTTIRKPVFKTK
jgi:hypothetical protein